MLLRALARPLPAFVHVHFHDWDLVDAKRVTALELGLRLLRRRRRPLDLAGAAEVAAATAPEVPFAEAAEIESAPRGQQAPLAGHADG
jgi:hypothetical protein